MNETIVKDLDRPSSEMNLHHSNTLRNSFILEEEEETTGHEPPKMTARSDLAGAAIEEENAGNEIASEFERKFELPFPELLYINLADNQVNK